MRTLTEIYDHNTRGIYTGLDLGAMKANQYWVDYDNARVIFGDGTDGYIPPVNSSISIVYHPYDLITTIDTTPAQWLLKPSNI